ncbi:MAG TPA: hypothetical protein VNC78_12130 [Actinomycetota bacterium]|nr:hypothetical protein [Actinomycetota bacterium]
MSDRKLFLVTSVVVSLGFNLTFPAVARTVATFARNAARVDGLSAVPARTAKAKRAGKLVATNESGTLPANAMAKAPDSALLGGFPPELYLPSHCASGLAAVADVPGDVVSGDEVGSVFIHDDEGRINGRSITSCRRSPLTVVHPDVGVYELHLAHAARCSSESQPLITHSSFVTIKSDTVPLVATTSTTCDDEGFALERVRLFDLSGTPRDSYFSFIILGSFPVPPFP